MLGFLKNIFKSAPKVDMADVIARGAVIVDVRTPGEYAGGHVKGSVNIPLNTLQAQMSKLKKDKPVITCCASGMRSGSARAMLTASGFAEVYNGGSWYNLKKYEK
jgi:rhodanese-related sulfurtransferase